MKSCIYLFFLCISLQVIAAEWFVSPLGDKRGKGNLESPWDLQTALNGGPNKIEVKEGDVIWLLSGEYKGKFVANISSRNLKKPITVSSYRNNWAILNGNVNTDGISVLTVKGSHLIFKNFEITHLGRFTRDTKKTNFRKGLGINHIEGKNCKFINLVIHDNPGTAVGSWKKTAGTEFYGCIVYNNGYISSGKGKINHGPAFYVQNSSNQVRLFENNIVFNNFSHGYEIWSANKNAGGTNDEKEYIKNITVTKNSIFNNSLPFRSAQADVVVSSMDQTGVNFPKNITLSYNQIYKNTYSPTSGYGNAIRLNEFSENVSAIKDIKIFNNLLVSRNQGFIIGKTATLTFKNNFLITGFITIGNNNHKINPYKNWNFSNNTYYTKSNDFIRINGMKNKIPFDTWTSSSYNLDKNSLFNRSKSKPAPKLKSIEIINIIKNKYKPLLYKVAIFDGDGETSTRGVNVDFSDENISEGMYYSVIDVENYPKKMKSGVLNKDKVINLNLGSKGFSYPRGQDISKYKFKKTFKNFGVFLVEFKKEEKTKKDSKEVSVYPIPTDNTEILHIESEHTITHIEINSVLGSHIFSKKINSQKHNIDISILSSGIYFLKIYMNNGEVKIKKIIKN